jgi:hypothetical protein
VLEDVEHLHVSELKQPLTSAGSVEDLPPAPPLRIREIGNIVLVLVSVGDPINPPSHMNVRADMSFSTVVSIVPVGFHLTSRHLIKVINQLQMRDIWNRHLHSGR